MSTETASAPGRSPLRLAGFYFNHLFVLAYCGVLLSAFVVQFAGREFPCPLCILQRMAMILCAMGPAYIIARARRGPIDRRTITTGYGMSLLAAVAGALMSSRQILLHIVPPDPGYGGEVLGLHLYSWALITFLVVIAAIGAYLMFDTELAPGEVRFGWFSRAVLILFGVIIVANLLAIFAQEGFHWYLPDNPDRYRLFG